MLLYILQVYFDFRGLNNAYIIFWVAGSLGNETLIANGETKIGLTLTNPGYKR